MLPNSVKIFHTIYAWEDFDIECIIPVETIYGHQWVDKLKKSGRDIHFKVSNDPTMYSLSWEFYHSKNSMLKDKNTALRDIYKWLEKHIINK